MAIHFIVIALKVPFFTILALCTFAVNSMLCSNALSGGEIDPASFTFVRLLAASITLSIILYFRN